MPSADYQLTKLAGLNLSVKRHIQGCFAGSTLLRLAKDLAEITTKTGDIPNQKSPTSFFAPLLATICQVLTTSSLSLQDSISRSSDTYKDVSQAVHFFALRKILLTTNRGARVSRYNMEKILKEVFEPIEISDWNSLFYITHQGGPMIFFNQVEFVLGLDEGKMWASRKVLSKYGNMVGACVFIVLDEMRKKSIKDVPSTTSDGLDWGVAFVFGPGFTVDTVVMHSMSVTIIH
ncbi:Chalcone synthase [Heracleum sosnowskyi]|uniref:Chalcone synthase n=1 Tax=Heracleum sosnowskyi TaxID=360622 RepID=A0AAD8J5H6_9APIA|nr:Chalcone synthase [Heracleum sosnowskyi]